MNDREFTNINVKESILLNGKPIAGFVVGDFKPWLSRTPPEDWLNMDGQEVSRATYAKLFEVIGTVGGAGDGSTTFNIPNLNGRTPVGYKADDTDLDAIGKTGGEKAHTLSIGEMPGHAHGGQTGDDSPDHSHTMQGNTGQAWGTTPMLIGQSTANATGNTGGASARHKHPIASEGGGQSHNIMQPFFVVNWIIKYQ
jgi:microcystin-dependent protein